MNQAAIKTLEKKLNDQPIGVLDSGIGGLTVVREIIRKLPNESIIYIGDTARVPYGTRGKETIKIFALELLSFLLKQNVKFIVVACNTISATCLEELKNISHIEILDVIKPSVKRIVTTTKNKKVGIIGTSATIRSGVYEEEIKKIDVSIKIETKATPLFVPIIEEGLGNSEIAKVTAKHYLSSFTDVDTLHLACTHYPLFRRTVQEALGNKVRIVDSAEPTAQELKNSLERKKLLNTSGNLSNLILNFTDLSELTSKTAEEFIGKNIRADINQISLVV